MSHMIFPNRMPGDWRTLAARSQGQILPDAYSGVSPRRDYLAINVDRDRKPSGEPEPALPEVVYFDDGFVPPVAQAHGRNILHRPGDILAQSDLLGDVRETAAAGKIIGSVEFSPEPFVPKPEEVKAENIHVRPDELIVRKPADRLISPASESDAKTVVPNELCGVVEMSVEGYVPPVEEAKAENIHVSPGEMVVSGPKGETESDYEFLRRVGQAYRQMLEHAARIVVGQQPAFEGLVIAMVSRGHCLLSGPPGMAKTTIVSTLARLFGLEFRRVTLTSDLAPRDIAQVELRQEDGKQIIDGPLFANVLLVEEINCGPPKTQMTLLNAIQDERVTLGPVRYPLPKPFFVVATETPIERDHVSPLTASQQDRFMMKLIAGYPSFEEEFELARGMASLADREIRPAMSCDDLVRLQDLVPRTPVSDEVAEFAVNMVRKTRVEDHAETFEFVPQQVAWGASTRSLQALVRAAQARAVLSGRTKTAKSDVRFVSKLVLRHRLVMQPNASLSSDDVIEQLD